LAVLFSPVRYSLPLAARFGCGDDGRGYYLICAE
jgi:hypothetical protein